ncbi:hypothetical protein HOH45_02475 [bacterium]|jgi:hypothetical protein|nr:hypothetical protein [bacterium]
MDEEKEFKKLKDAVESGDPDKQKAIGDFAENLASTILSKFKNLAEQMPSTAIKTKHIPTPDVDLSLLFEAPPEPKEEIVNPIKQKEPTPPKPVQETTPHTEEEKRQPPLKKEPIIIPSSYSPKKEQDHHQRPPIKQSRQSFTDVLKDKLSTESSAINKVLPTEKPSPSIEPPKKQKLKKKPVLNQTKEKPKPKVKAPKKTVAAAKKMISPKDKNKTKTDELKLKKKSGDLLENRFKKRQQNIDEIIKGDKGSLSSKSI